MGIKSEKVRSLTALLSLLSVVVSITAAGLYLGNEDAQSLLAGIFSSMIAAAIAAAVGIFSSRSLRGKREAERIFLIYAREDLPEAEDLYYKLKELGFNPWLDKEDLLPGEVWRQSVLKALSESVVALVLVSENLLQKRGFALEEVQTALSILQDRDKGRSPIIPVRLSDVEVPSPLAHIQWVDLFQERGLRKLQDALEYVTNRQKTPNPSEAPSRH